jgi:hypothetical protein
VIPMTADLIGATAWMHHGAKALRASWRSGSTTGTTPPDTPGRRPKPRTPPKPSWVESSDPHGHPVPSSWAATTNVADCALSAARFRCGPRPARRSPRR